MSKFHFHVSFLKIAKIVLKCCIVRNLQYIKFVFVFISIKVLHANQVCIQYMLSHHEQFRGNLFYNFA